VVAEFILLILLVMVDQELLLFAILVLNEALAELSLLLAATLITHLPHQGHLQHEPFC
jgi:hypothetical protein